MPNKTPVESPGESATETPESALLFDPTDVAENDYIRVYRRDELTKQMHLQFRLAPEEQTEDRIKELRGGGQYKCQVIGADELGKMLVKRSRLVTLDGPPKPLVRDPWQERQARATPGGATPVAAVTMREPQQGEGKRVGIDEILSAGILNLFNAHADASKAQVEAMRSIAESRAGSSSNDLILKALIDNQTEMMKMLAGRKDDAPDPLEAIERIGGILKSIMPPATPAGGMKEMLETMNEVLDLKDRNQGPPEDPIMGVVKELGPKVLEILDRASKQDPQAAEAAKRLREVARTQRAESTGTDGIGRSLPAGTTTAAPAAGGDVQPWQRIVDSRAPHWLKMATQYAATEGAKADPVMCAEYEIDVLLPAEYRPMLTEFLRHEQVLAMIVERYPALQPHVDPWLVLFVLAGQEELGIVPEGTVNAMIDQLEAASDASDAENVHVEETEAANGTGPRIATDDRPARDAHDRPTPRGGGPGSSR